MPWLELLMGFFVLPDDEKNIIQQTNKKNEIFPCLTC